jgi:hypothetical protein
MKKLLILLIFMPIWHSFGQSIEFDYDASGNRINRHVIRLSNAPQNAPSNAFYEENLANAKIVIYPNPTQGELRVDILDIEIKSASYIDICDYSGKIITKQKNIGSTNILDLSQQPNGIYLMKISLKDAEQKETTTTWKIVKY